MICSFVKRRQWVTLIFLIIGGGRNAPSVQISLQGTKDAALRAHEGHCRQHRSAGHSSHALTFFQRRLAAARAISERRAGPITSARFLPPLSPAATAFGFFPCSSGFGSRSSTWPVAMPIMALASWFGSRGRLARIVLIAPPSFSQRSMLRWLGSALGRCLPWAAMLAICPRHGHAARVSQ